MKGIKLVVFPVKDLEKAKVFDSAFLSVEPYADSSYYVGYKVGELEVGLDPHGQDVVGYTEVVRIEERMRELVAAGGTVHLEPKNVGGGLVIAQVKDRDGNVLGLRQLAS